MSDSDREGQDGAATRDAVRSVFNRVEMAVAGASAARASSEFDEAGRQPLDGALGAVGTAEDPISNAIMGEVFRPLQSLHEA
jgi:hypothetical protein